jgi:hypothetical protein
MANYKRKRPRTSHTHSALNRREAEKPDYRWLGNWPRWHDVIFHTRPRRRAESRTIQAVLSGQVDADAALWPHSKKPHVYYW